MLLCINSKEKHVTLLLKLMVIIKFFRNSFKLSHPLKLFHIKDCCIPFIALFLYLNYITIFRAIWDAFDIFTVQAPFQLLYILSYSHSC